MGRGISMKQISISYTDLKSIADELKLTYYYVDFTESYGLFVYDKGRDLLFDARIEQDGGADETDFDDNVKSDATLATDTNDVIAKAEQQFKPLLKVVIEEESPDKHTGRHYQSQSFEIAADATNGWKETTISFPYAISLLSAEWINKTENEGDEVEFLVGEDTIVGAITSDVSATDTVINVQKSVVNNVYVGAYIKLTEGGTTDNVGRILSIDKSAKQITIETATTNAFTAAGPTYVKMTVKIVPHLILVGNNVPMSIGESKIGASYIPANAVLKARYNNISAIEKTFSFVLEYLY